MIRNVRESNARKIVSSIGRHTWSNLPVSEREEAIAHAEVIGVELVVMALRAAYTMSNQVEGNVGS